MNTIVEQDAGISLSQSFTVAAWVIILGVVGSWVFLKQGTGQVVSDLPDIPNFTLATLQDNSEVSLIELAEQAYAAGRITRPESNSALHYYQKTLQRDALNASAQDGVSRVLDYLINGAESALLQEDWLAAADFAQQTLAIDSNNLAARSVMSRVQRYERIRLLSDQAVEYIAAGNLTDPRGGNALESYRQILLLDPESVVAQQGVESVAQRIASIAQTEAFAENHERARELISLAKSIAPDAPGISQTEQLTLQWTDMVKDQAVKEDLLAAARAMQAGHLSASGSPEGVGALEHYQAVLDKDPGSAAAKAGVQLVISGLTDQAWSYAYDERVEQAQRLVRHARDAGASEIELGEINAELDFLRRRALARNGEFSEVLAIRELVARRQGAPVLPRNAVEGWVELLFTVDEEGSVVDVDVVEATQEALREPALVAVRKWRFDPYLESGRPIPVRSGVRFNFQT